MSGAKHTPGPWQADYTNVYSTTGGLLDKRVSEVSTQRDEYEANARLIASAPELLEAAQAYLRVRDDCYGNVRQLDAALANLRAAIARATGVDE